MPGDAELRSAALLVSDRFKMKASFEGGRLWPDEIDAARAVSTAASRQLPCFFGGCLLLGDEAPELMGEAGTLNLTDNCSWTCGMLLLWLSCSLVQDWREMREGRREKECMASADGALTGEEMTGCTPCGLGWILAPAMEPADRIKDALGDLGGAINSNV